MQQNWPQRLWLVRHGESAGNVARDAADASGSHRVEIAGRDVDVPLSEPGVIQSRALGRWFAELPAAERPEVIVCSPYLRARHTAEIIRDVASLPGAPGSWVIDERLREREFGVWTGSPKRASKSSIRSRQRRALVGKFYHRPPGGESWCDVILRMRSTLHTLSLHYAGRRVLVVTHQVVVLCLRYLLEDMDEATVLHIDRTAEP